MAKRTRRVKKATDKPLPIAYQGTSRSAVPMPCVE